MNKSIKMVMLLAAVVSLFAASAVQAAPSQTATYVGGGVFGTGVTSTIAAAKIGIGGYSFLSSTKPLTLKITDATTVGDIGFTACQVKDPNAVPRPVCGLDNQTITQTGCTPANSGAVTLAGFVTGQPLIVFTDTADLVCEGNATTGTITVTYL